MTNMKKIVSVLMALVMVLSLSVSAFADGTATTGSITIGNAISGQTYSAYQLLTVSYADDLSAFTYRLIEDSPWNTFLRSSDILGKYIKINERNEVEWIQVCNNTDPAHTEHTSSCVHVNADPAEFAKLALAYAKANDDMDATNSVTPDRVDADNNNIADKVSATISNLPLGYYLVDSSAGVLCSLDTTVPSISVEEKNDIPVNEKKVVREDGITAEDATYEIGDTVPFINRITFYNGTQNLVFHDVMEESLTLDKDSIAVYMTPKSAGNTIDSDNYTVAYDVKHEGHTCTLGSACDMASKTCTFEIRFKQEFIDSLTATNQASYQISVYYEAELNANAKEQIYPETNDNDSKITFGDKSCSVWDDAIVKTYGFELIKVDELHKVIEGAEFELYNVDPTTTGATPMELVKVSDGTSATDDPMTPAGYDTYRPAVAKDKADTSITIVTKIPAGYVRVVGIKNNATYYLKEVTTPAGYNTLAAPISFALSDTNNYAVLTRQIDSAENGKAHDHWVSGGVHVVNEKGLMMPETGGMGTTLFYVIGGVLFVGAAVVLITKKRMSSEA